MCALFEDENEQDEDKENGQGNEKTQPSVIARELRKEWALEKEEMKKE